MHKGNLSAYEIMLGELVAVVTGVDHAPIPYSSSEEPLIDRLAGFASVGLLQQAIVQVGARYFRWRYIDDAAGLSFADVSAESDLVTHLVALTEMLSAQMPDLGVKQLMGHLYDHLLASVHLWAQGGIGGDIGAQQWIDPDAVWSDFMEAVCNGELGSLGAIVAEIGHEAA